MIRKYAASIIFAVISVSAGAISSLGLFPGLPEYQTLIKPSFTPPAILFPIIWTLLYILMGVEAGIVWKSKHESRTEALAVFEVQLLVNVLWSFIFLRAAPTSLHYYGYCYCWHLLRQWLWNSSALIRSPALYKYLICFGSCSPDT